MTFDFKNMFSSFGGNAQTSVRKVVGIDFGSSSVKVVEVEQNEEILQLTTYGELQLGPYSNAPLGSSLNLDVSVRTEAIVDVLRESDVQAKDSIMTLPLSESFVTTISIIAKKDEDINPRINVEARKHIPVPLSDVTLEWAEIEPLKDTTDNVHEVLLAAIQNKALSESKQILQSLQKVSQPSELELFSVLRAVTKESDSSIAVLDLGAKTNKLYISQGGFLRGIHRVQSGGAFATQRIAKLLDIPFGDAENIKRNFVPNSEEATDIKKAVVSSFEKTMQEFKRVLNQYEIKSGSPLSRVVLTGGSASFYDIDSFINYSLDRQTVLANPFTKVAYPAFMQDTLTAIAPTYAVALGAALRPFEQ